MRLKGLLWYFWVYFSATLVQTWGFTDDVEKTIQCTSGALYCDLAGFRSSQDAEVRCDAKPRCRNTDGSAWNGVECYCARVGSRATTCSATQVCNIDKTDVCAGVPLCVPGVLMIEIEQKWHLRKLRINGDEKGFCDIFGRTFLQFIFLGFRYVNWRLREFGGLLVCSTW